MTLSPLLVLWILGAPALLGVLLLRGLGLRFADDRLGYPAWCWLAGCLVHAGTLLLCLLLHVEPWLWAAAPGLAAVPLWLWARHRPATAGALPAPQGRGRALLWAVVAIGVLFCLLQFTAAASRPCVEGDEGNLWALKAKSLLIDWYTGDFAAAQQWNVHPDYPLLNPLLQAWVHSQAGAIVHFENRLPIHLCILALWLATAAALRRRVAGWLAAPMLLLVLCGQSFTWLCRAAYADGMVALGLVVALDGWLRRRESGGDAWAWLLALGAAFALWAKNETMLYAAAAAGAVGVAWLRWRPPWPGRAALRWLLPPLLVVIVQAAWNRWFGFQNDLFGANPTGKSLPVLFAAQFADRAPRVAERAFSLIGGLQREYGAMLVLLLAPLLWPRAALGRTLLVPTLTLIGGVIGLHLTYIGSWLDLDYHLLTSHERVLFQLLPATVVWLGALWQEIRRAAPTAAPGVPSPAVRPADRPAADLS